MNWGNKLLVVFGVFAGLMAYMTYQCFQVPVSLVSKEYYKDEIKYQDVIDGTNNANLLSKEVKLSKQNGQIVIQFPEEMKNQPLKGSILFYAPANVKYDKRFVLKVDEEGKQSIKIDQFQKGNYQVKIIWKTQKSHYYNEQSIAL